MSRIHWAAMLAIAVPEVSRASWTWIEGEHASETNIGRHSWYAGAVKKSELSSGDFLAHFDAKGPGRPRLLRARSG